MWKVIRRVVIELLCSHDNVYPIEYDDKKNVRYNECAYCSAHVPQPNWPNFKRKPNVSVISRPTVLRPPTAVRPPLY